MMNMKIAALSSFILLTSAAAIDAAPIVPQDGLWRGDATGGSVEDCNPMMENMLQNNGAFTQKGETRRIKWGGKFDPNSMNIFNEEGAPMAWESTGENSYKGKIFDGSSCANADTNSCTRVGATVTMQLISPTKIEGTTLVELGTLMGDTEAMAALKQMGMADCKVNVTYDVQRVGD
ncbi:hypothetical protein [Maritalea mobilis]|nr:hypothetical protein [Maritalea mobilis]